jgi:DNA-binding IclR family transcriptional regulator
VHVAWAGPQAEQRWLAQARTILGPVAVEAALAELAGVRQRGYAVSAGTQAAAEFERTVHVTSDSAAPDLSGVLPALLARAGAGPADLDNASEVTSLHAPVFGADGQVALSLTLNGFNGTESAQRLRHCLDRLLVAARSITEKLGGSQPS